LKNINKLILFVIFLSVIKELTYGSTQGGCEWQPDERDIIINL